MRILVLGGDGYLGWPSALHLSASGTRSRSPTTSCAAPMTTRWVSSSLVPIEPLHVRVRAWQELTGKRIDVFAGDLCDADFTHDMLRSGGRTRSCISPSSAPRRTR